jgi:calcium-dependent protein kinase
VVLFAVEMGCAESKEEAVVSRTPTPPERAAEGRPPKTNATSAPIAAPTHTNPTNSNNSGTTATTNGDAHPAMVMVTNLNDVVRAADHPEGRGRFLSYASGASTPNTSSGNISWDTNAEEKGGSDRNIALEDVSTRLRGNPKVLKTSGSAIGLDEIHQTEGAGLTSKVVHIEVPFGKPIEEVYDGVHNGPVLGSGVSGLVRLVTHKATGLEYAVKCLDLGLVGTKEGLAQLREEIFIMCQLDHPNIVRLEEVYESHSEIYLVQELCHGGELFDRLDEQPDYHYTEGECARLVKQMLSAVRYLHSKGIIHRDLKLENFLFSSKAQDSELKMIDFGLSKHFRFGEVHHEAVGTPYTVAPEVIHGSYDERCDIWAIGVITFLLLSGDPPFGGCGGPEPLLTVRGNILACKYAFEPDDIWGLVSTKAKEFVKAMLVVDPKNRPTAREAQKHSWLKEWAGRQSTKDDKILNPNVVKALVSFKEFSHMRKLLSEVLSFTLLPDQIKELRKEFEKMDTDGSGEISMAGLKQVLVTNAGAGSLGALTEEEVEDIFDAMRVNKAETRIHWHEFIAAGLSQCRVDDRNLRLAFDRLDGDHKGVSCRSCFFRFKNMPVVTHTTWKLS